MQRCSQFLRLLPTRPHLPKVLALCPEGEHHQMGLMLFSLFLRNKGMQVIYLGPDTPMRELSRLISLIQASVVAVSITNPALLKEVEDAFELCRSEMPSVTFAVGGAAFDNRETRLADYVLSNSKADWETWYRNGNFENTSAEHSFI
nr:cobalamin B12-binding domain-containing protein [Paenibacillus anseongense]